MSQLVNVGSSEEWQQLLSKTNVVIADFYADWCGPCKMIAPHFERLSKEHSKPNKVAFAKVNVDTQSAVARSNAVSAMPTFKIFHGGNCIETIKGANPSALTTAITNAVKLADSTAKSGAPFKTPGRTLGGEAAAPVGLFHGWDLRKIVNVAVAMFDGHKAAENSMFNINRPRPAASRAAPGQGSSGGGASNSSRPPPKATFKTLADLGL